MDIYMYTIVSVSDLNVALTLVFKQEEQCNTKCALTLWAFGQTLGGPLALFLPI